MENNEQELIDLKAKIESLENIIKNLSAHIQCNTLNIRKLAVDVHGYSSPFYLHVVSDECIEKK